MTPDLRTLIAEFDDIGVDNNGDVRVPCPLRDQISIALSKYEELKTNLQEKPQAERVVAAVGKGYLTTCILMLCPDGAGVGHWRDIRDIPLDWPCSCGNKHWFSVRDAYVTFHPVVKDNQP